MSDFKARIGRIRMKNGGAEVRVLNREPINPDGENWRGSILSGARKIGERATNEAQLVGYIVVGVYRDGAASVGYRWDYDNCPVPRAMIPAWIAEILRRDLISEPQAKDVFNEMFGWRDQ